MSASQELIDAWRVPGKSPRHHQKTKAALAIAWHTLFNAVDSLVNELEKAKK